MTEPSRALPSALLPNERVESVTVIVEMASGLKRVIVSRPDSINQNDGVAINEEQRIHNDVLPREGQMVDITLQRTVSWTEQWTEMSR